MKLLTRAFVTVCMMILLDGCAGIGFHQPVKVYKEGELEANSTILVKGFQGEPGFIPRLQPGERVLISCVDGQDLHVSSLVGYQDTNSVIPNRIQVAPGLHGLTVSYSGKMGYAYSKLWFKAEEGKEYLINRGLDGYAVKLWVEDAQGSRAVGGDFGTEPKNGPAVIYCQENCDAFLPDHQESYLCKHK